MSSVDNRIVNMQFNNKQFQSGASDSIQSLEDLEKTISEVGTSGGLDDMGAQVDGIATRFGALQIAGVAALATIASQATTTALALGRDLLGSVTSTIFGAGASRAIDLEQAKFQFRGLGLDVKEVMANATEAVTGTAFALNEAATVATQFAGSGVKAGEDMTVALRGVSGVAAQTGKSYAEIGQIFAGVSGLGKLTTQDLMQFGVRGLDITQALADEIGVTQDQIKVMVSEGQIDFKTFAKAMDEAFGKNAVKANRTFTGALANMKVALARIGADFFTPLLKSGGDVFNALGEFFTKIQGAVGPLSKSFGQLTQVMADNVVAFFESVKVAKLFGPIIEGFKNIVSPFMAVARALGEAWVSVFPQKQNQGRSVLNSLAEGFLILTKPMRFIADLIPNLTPIFAAFFGIIKDAGTILDPIVQGFKNLAAPFAAIFKVLGDAWRDVFSINSSDEQVNGVNTLADALAFLARGFETLTKPVAWVAEQIPKLTPLFTALFEVIDDLNDIDTISASLNNLGNVAADIGGNIIAGIVEGFDSGSIKAAIESFASSIIDWIKAVLGIASPAAELVPVGESIVQGIAQGIVGAIKFIFSALATIGGAIIDGFKQLFGEMDALDWTALFNAILTGGLLFVLIKMAKTITSFIQGFGETLAAIGNPIGTLSDALKGMQDSVKPPILIQIAIAVGVLTASLIALSLIPKDKLVQGTVALAGVVGLMLGAVKALAVIDPKDVFAASASLILLSSAMLIMAGAVAAFGQIGPDKIGQGLTTMAISLTLMIGAVEFLGALGPTALAGAGAIFIISAAMVALAGAVAAFGQIDPENVGKALGTMAVSLALVVGAVSYLGALGPAALAGAGGIFIVASAMVILAGAIAAFAKTAPEKTSQALVTMGVALALIAVATAALGAIGPATLAGAGAIFIVAAAMRVLASALAVMGKVGPEKMSQGLTTVAVALAIFLAAAAVAGIAHVAIGLGVLALSMLLFGEGVFLLGVGLLAAATAFTLFAAVFAAGTGVILTGIGALLTLLPVFALQLANSFVVFVEAIAAAAPRLREAFGEIIKGILGTIRDAIPQFRKTAKELLDALFNVVKDNINRWAQLFGDLVAAGLRVIRQNIDDYVDTGVAIVLAFISGITKRLDDIIKAGTDVVVAVIKGIGNSSRRIVTAAAETIGKFVKALPPAVRDLSEDLSLVGFDIAVAIAQGIYDGLITRGIELAKAGAEAIANALPEWMQKVLGIASPSKVAHWIGEMFVQGLADGIRDSIGRAVGATVALANAVIAAGDKLVAKAQRQASKRQFAAEKAAARARLSDRFAKQAEKAARQSPKNKDLQQAAKQARNLADKQAKAAQDAQKKAEAAAQKVQDVQAFRDADKQGKGDILTARAKLLSDRAVKKLAEANAAAIAARKATGKERDRLMKEAKKEAEAAKRLADQSKAARKRADDYYAESVKDRIEAIRKAQERERKAAKEEREFNQADDAGKAAILESRAEAARKKAEAARKQSEALIKQARNLAKKDAARSQRLLDRAERLAQQAQDGIDQAKEDKEAALSLLNQDSTSGGSIGVTLELSRSAMEDAASAIDRYTKSLQQAEEAAQAATPVYQFVQTNTSPVALTDTEIYRQTRNLLSAAEIKMGVTT